MKKTADEGNSTEQTYLAFKSISVIAGNLHESALKLTLICHARNN